MCRFICFCRSVRSVRSVRFPQVTFAEIDHQSLSQNQKHDVRTQNKREARSEKVTRDTRRLCSPSVRRTVCCYITVASPAPRARCRATRDTRGIGRCPRHARKRSQCPRATPGDGRSGRRERPRHVLSLVRRGAAAFPSTGVSACQQQNPVRRSVAMSRTPGS